MNSKELTELIELISQRQIAEFEMEMSGFKLRVRTTPSATSAIPPGVSVQPVVSPGIALPLPVESLSIPAPSLPMAPISSALAPPTAAPENLYTVKAPIVGTFYRSPSPTAKSFVEVGARVQTGTVLCIIEAMKLMNEIESDVNGEIVEIHVENGKSVEYGQPLFSIKRN